MKTPTKAQIIKSASTSPEAKKALQELFPEVFEEDKYLNLESLIKPHNHFTARIFTEDEIKTIGAENSFMEVYTGYQKNLYHKAFWLNGDHYNWELRKLKDDHYLLIPTKK